MSVKRSSPLLELHPAENCTAGPRANSQTHSIVELAAVFAICLLPAILFGDSLNNPPTADDYILFAEIGAGRSWVDVGTPIKEHFVPVLRALYLVQYHLFGMDLRPMHTLLLLLHLVAVFLCYRSIALLTFDRRIGLLSGLLFGISTAHASVPMTLVTIGQELAAICFLTSLLFFLKYLRSGHTRDYVLAVLFHFFMPFCFSSGFTVPFIFLSAVLLKEATIASKTLWKGLVLITPFWGSLFIYILVRMLFLEPDRAIPLQVSSPLGRIPDALATLFWGAAFRYGTSYTAALLLDGLSRFWVKIAVICVFLVYVAAALRARRKLRAQGKNAILLLFAAFLLYFVPAFGRAEDGLHLFTHTDRYAYLSGTMVAGFVALLFVVIWDSCQNAGRICCMAVLLTVLGTNIVLVWHLAQKQDKSLQRFEIHRKAFLNELHSLSKTEQQAIILDLPFTDRLTNVVAWSALPSRVCLAYRKDAFCQQFRFVNERKLSRLGRIAYFRVLNGSGQLQLRHNTSKSPESAARLGIFPTTGYGSKPDHF